MSIWIAAFPGMITRKMADLARGGGAKPALRVARAVASGPDVYADITGGTAWFVFALRHSAMAWRGDIDVASCDTCGDQIAAPSAPHASGSCLNQKGLGSDSNAHMNHRQPEVRRIRQ